jgi:DNA polymerase-1
MTTLTLDIETHSQELLYEIEPEEFVRLIGYAWGNGPVRITTSLEEIKEQISKAKLIVGHNIHTFDLRAIYGIYSNIPMQLADQNRVYDTWTHASLVHPAPYTYINRFGKKALADSPEKMKAWFGLDEQAHQLGVAGKTYDLKELAYEFGDPGIKNRKEREADGFGKIPIDDPRYIAYLVGDVEASRTVGKALLKLGGLDAYAMREQRIESRKATISSNGWRVDQKAAKARSDALKARRDVLLAELAKKYDFPMEGDKPWLTNPGKNAIMSVLADHGIRPNKDWPTTPGYAKLNEAKEKAKAAAAEAAELRVWLDKEIQENPKFRRVKGTEGKIRKLEEQSVVPVWFGLSLSGDTLKNLTKDTAIEELGTALAELMGQRSLADLTLECTFPDGKVHPEITMLQRSGRWSTTEPGLTIWDESEKYYYVPDNEDEALLEIDLSNADARVVAALSGDTKYAERFVPGADGHLINAWAVWGKDVVGTEKKGNKYRDLAKPMGHGWSYGGRANTLSQQTGAPLEAAKEFVKKMDATFHVIVKWQNKVRKFASTHGYVKNLWGRKLQVEKGHEFTQAPALLGQNGTREIMCDALLAFSYNAVRSIKAQIHDAFVFSIPAKDWEKYRDYLLSKMETSMNPKGGQYIAFPADCGKPGKNWLDACH